MNQFIDEIEKIYIIRVNDALSEVKSGQHLRFILGLYKTKEVCLEAVKYESSHTDMLNDIYSVPIGTLDYVVTQMRIIKKDSPYYLEQIEKAYSKIKNNSQTQKNLSIFENCLESYKAIDHNDLIKKQYYKLQETL